MPSLLARLLLTGEVRAEMRRGSSVHCSRALFMNELVLCTLLGERVVVGIGTAPHEIVYFRSMHIILNLQLGLGHHGLRNWNATTVLIKLRVVPLR